MRYHKLPNGMGEGGVRPVDQFVYLCLRSFMNFGTLESFPSIRRVTGMSGLTAPTVRSCVRRLVGGGYLSVGKRGRGNVYLFTDPKRYEPFTDAFIGSAVVSVSAKSFLVASQQYMFKDMRDYGKISMSNRELARRINASEGFVRTSNRELMESGVMSLNSGTKTYRLSMLGQRVGGNGLVLDCDFEEFMSRVL